GDTIAIRDNQVIVNGVAEVNPPQMQFAYDVFSKGKINERNLEKIGLGREDYQFLAFTADGGAQYVMYLIKEKAEEIKQLPYIKSIALNESKVEDALPYSPYYGWSPVANEKHYYRWTRDNFGPLWVPFKGAKLAINDSTLALYGTTIRLYDHNDDVKIEGGKL